MGGMGSGGWNRSGRSTVQETPTLAMPALKRAGLLAPGASRSWRWSVAGREIASIGAYGTEDGVRLAYVVGCGHERQCVDEQVDVQWRACRFGGARPYFACPRCRQAALNLHLSVGRFVCRGCARLVYATQREHARDRQLRAANRLRAKLGGEPGVQSPFGDRPRGMRARTYERIVDEIERREALAMEELAGFLMRITQQRAPGARPGFWR